MLVSTKGISSGRSSLEGKLPKMQPKTTGVGQAIGFYTNAAGTGRK
jgi:hypothetical protein